MSVYGCVCAIISYEPFYWFKPDVKSYKMKTGVCCMLRPGFIFFDCYVYFRFTKTIFSELAACKMQMPLWVLERTLEDEITLECVTITFSYLKKC